MDENSINSAEYTYEKKPEGKLKIYRSLLILGYVLFMVGFFTVCCVTKLIPIFAVSPFLLWIIIFFTWRYVSYDCYVEVEGGTLSLGTFINSKSGRKKTERFHLKVRETDISLYSDAKSEKSLMRVCDLSSSALAENRLIAVFEENGKTVGVIFDSIPKILKLLKISV